jgi:hypothetical protein
MEFIATEAIPLGGRLGNDDSSQSWQDVEFGIEVRDDAVIEVVESGTSRGTFGSMPPVIASESSCAAGWCGITAMALFSTRAP